MGSYAPTFGALSLCRDSRAGPLSPPIPPNNYVRNLLMFTKGLESWELRVLQLGEQ